MLNKIILIGRVGQDPTIRNLDNGLTVANFTLATSEKYKNKAGEKLESTEWHNCQVWGSLAKIVEEYVKKGQLLYVEGKVKTESWDKDGIKHYKTVVEVKEMKMLGGGSSQGAPYTSTDKAPSNEFQPESTDDLPF